MAAREKAVTILIGPRLSFYLISAYAGVAGGGMRGRLRPGVCPTLSLLTGYHVNSSTIGAGTGSDSAKP